MPAYFTTLVLRAFLSYCSEKYMGLSSAGFSLWGLVLARANFHRLKPTLLNPASKF